MKTAFIIAVGALLLGGCAAGPLSLKDSKRPPKYNAPKVLRFDDWFSEPDSCVLTGNSIEVKATTTGALEDGNIELRLVFAAPLAARPRVELTTYPVPLTFDGSGQSFTLQLPYSATSVAHYIQPDSFLTIHYQPAHEDGELELNFGTAGIVSGVTYLSRACK